MMNKALIPFNRPAFGKPFGTAFGKGFGSHDEFNPSDIDNLVIWLDAGTGVLPASGPVDSWADRSKNGNNATGTLTERPVFNATGINGFPSLTFDGVNDKMDAANAPSLNFTGSFTAYVVNRCTNFTGLPTMFGKSGPDFTFKYNSNGAGRGVVTQTVTSLETTTLNTPNIMELHWDVPVGGVIEFTENGVPLGAAQFSTVGAILRDTNVLHIGEGGMGSQFFVGEIGQVLIFDRLLTIEERNQVGSYLASKYHLPWTDIVPNPDDIPGLVLWLDAAREVIGSDVSSWGDQSGNENNAFQGNAGKRPFFDATALNGFPALTFDSSTDENMEIDNKATINLDSSFTYYTVINTTDLGAIRYLIGRDNPNGYEIFVNSQNPTASNKNKINVAVRDTVAREDTQSDNAITEATDIILEVRYEAGGLVSFTQNGVLLGEIKSNSRTNINQSSSPLFIGSQNGSSGPFDGDMAQVLLFNRLLDLNERNLVGNYLAGRYDLTWTDIKPFAPTDFAGLVAWFDAAEGVTAPFNDVEKWTGQSPEAHDAVQDANFLKPVFFPNSPGLNGQPSIRFVDDSLVVSADSSLNFTGSFSFFIVANLRFLFDVPEPITFFSKNGDAGYRWLLTSANFPQIIASASTGPPQTITGSFVAVETPLILDLNFEVGGANRVKMTHNGRSLGDFLNKLANINGTSAALDLCGFSNEEYKGLIGQILIYNNLLSAPERNAVGNYLAERHQPLAWQNISTEIIPSDIAGIALWLDLNDGATIGLDGISNWVDRSGNGYVAVQNTVANQPGFSSSALGGQGALVWQPGIQQFMQMPVAQNSILDLQTSFTFYTVARLDGAASIFTLLSRNITNGYEFRISTLSKLETFINDGGGAETDTSANSVGGFQILEIHYAVEGTINFTANGVSLGTATNTLTGITSNAADLFIGARGPGVNPWFGEIAQFIIYNRLLTKEERNNVGLYLANRYGFTWTIIT